MTKRPKNEDAAPRASTPASGIRNNYRRGTAADFLCARIAPDSRLSVVSAFFTIYAFDALKDHLPRIEHPDFLFGETRFINALDFGSREKELFNGNEMGEDVRKLLVDYLRLLSAIRQTVSAEAPVVRNALSWSAKAFTLQA